MPEPSRKQPTELQKRSKFSEALFRRAVDGWDEPVFDIKGNH